MRFRTPEFPSHTAWHYLYGHIPAMDPMSTYAAVNHNGKTYHLFNAKRFPVGRMAAMISQFIRGKHKPGYNPRTWMEGDTCLVVNMEEPFFTGHKKDYKVYRHHTGYPGGLKEVSYKLQIEKKPERVLEDAINGMLPKNKLRKGLLRKYLVMYRGPYHEYWNILPQFTEPMPHNINDHMGFNDINPETTVVRYMETDELPQELEGLPIDIDPAIDEPFHAKRKTHREDSYNYRLADAYKRSHKGFKRFNALKRN